VFISEDEYLLAGTDLGYISAKRVEGVWTISLPPKQASNERFADVNVRFASVLGQLEANTIPVEIVPLRGNIQNFASGVPASVRHARTMARLTGGGA